MAVPPNVNIQIAGITFEATTKAPGNSLAATLSHLNANVRSKHNNSDEAGIYVIGLEYAGEPNNFLPIYVGQASNLRSRALQHSNLSPSNFYGGQILLNHHRLNASEIRKGLNSYYLTWHRGKKSKTRMISSFASLSTPRKVPFCLYFNDPIFYIDSAYLGISAYPIPSIGSSKPNNILGVANAVFNLYRTGLMTPTSFGTISDLLTDISESGRFIEANFRFAFIPGDKDGNIHTNCDPNASGIDWTNFPDVAKVASSGSSSVSVVLGINAAENAIREHLWENGEYVLGAR